MKKYGASLMMLCLMLAVTLGGACLHNAGIDSASANVPGRAQANLENPAPPDLEVLEFLGLEEFTATLPVMMIDTHNQKIQKENVIWAEIAVLDDPSGLNPITAAPDAVLTATVKYRGASSYSGFDKPQYRIKFYKDAEKSLDYGLFGLAADSEWVLNGPFLDRSLLRNYLMYTLAGQIMDWAPHCAFFELFLDGMYQGVYLAVEPVTASASRLNLSRFGLISGATAYIVKRDRVGTETNVLHTYGELAGYVSNELSVQYPGESKLIPLQMTWIEEDISRFERALYSDFFTDPQIGYAAYIDVDSFVDYLILNEFALNHDGGALSTYAYKELGGKLKLCVWDFNNGFDNYTAFTMATDEFILIDNAWFDRLLQDRNFVDRVVSRYRELRQGSLSNENIQAILDQGKKQLEGAAERNFALWGYTFKLQLLITGEDGEKRDPQSYAEAIQQLEEIIEARLAFLDTSLERLYDYCIP